MNRKEKLKSLIEKGKELLDNHSGKDNPKFSAWNTSIIRFMEREFGSDNTDTKRLKNRYYYPSVLSIGSDNSEIIYRKYKSDMEKTLSELESIYEEYEDIILDKGMVKSNDNYNMNVPNITLNVDNSNYNSNVNKGVLIAIILQYGHGTRNGGWVQGRDYINPAMQPLFDKFAEDAWREVTSA